MWINKYMVIPVCFGDFLNCLYICSQCSITYLFLYLLSVGEKQALIRHSFWNSTKRNRRCRPFQRRLGCAIQETETHWDSSCLHQITGTCHEGTAHQLVTNDVNRSQVFSNVQPNSQRTVTGQIILCQWVFPCHYISSNGFPDYSQDWLVKYHLCTCGNLRKPVLCIKGEYRIPVNQVRYKNTPYTGGGGTHL